jgi:hypothetical protein
MCVFYPQDGDGGKVVVCRHQLNGYADIENDNRNNEINLKYS